MGARIVLFRQEFTLICLKIGGPMLGLCMQSHDLGGPLVCGANVERHAIKDDKASQVPSCFNCFVCVHIPFV